MVRKVQGCCFIVGKVRLAEVLLVMTVDFELTGMAHFWAFVMTPR